MSIRRLFPFAALGMVIVLAGLLAAGWQVWWLAPILWLGRYPLFHVAAHFSIFAGVVRLYRPPQRSIKVWLVVVAGGLLIEVAQLAAGGFLLTAPILLDSLFDLAVDMSGALVCWLMTRPGMIRSKTAHPPLGRC